MIKKVSGITNIKKTLFGFAKQAFNGIAIPNTTSSTKSAVIFLTGIFLLTTITFAEQWNIRDFGAVGDGVTDDTRAIQEALNRAEKGRADRWRRVADGCGRIGWGVWDGSNDEVYFPTGTYRTTSTLVGGKGVKLSGEPGAVIAADANVNILFYGHRAFRYTLSQLTFRGGDNQFFFWTANQDTAGFLIRNCRFIESKGAAIRTVSHADTPTHKDNEWTKIVPVAPFTIDWKDGMPTLTPKAGKYWWANSTRMVVKNCEFKNCAAMYSGHGDGQFLIGCRFFSSIPLSRSVIDARGLLLVRDLSIKAPVPENAKFPWITYGNELAGGKLSVRGVSAISTTPVGLPLMSVHTAYQKRGAYGEYCSLILEDCEASVAGGATEAMVVIDECEPHQFTARRCREAAGRPVAMLHFLAPPKTEADLRKACLEPIPPLEHSHGYVFEANDPALDCALPPILKSFVRSPIQYGNWTFSPPVSSVAHKTETEINASKFSIGMEASPEDYAHLKELFDYAATVPFPHVILPGRTFELSAPLQLPAKLRLSVSGRAEFRSKKWDFPLFQATGDLDILFEGLVLSGGKYAGMFSGTGVVQMDDCAIYDSRGIHVTGDSNAAVGALQLNVNESVFYTIQAVVNSRARVRISNSWCSTLPWLDNDSYCINRNGILELDAITGVPVVFINHPNFPNWKPGKNIFWVQNSGVFRSRDVRYGGEFGGIPAVDNHANGSVMIEGAIAYFFSPHSIRHLIRNEDPKSRIVLRDLGSLLPASPGSGILTGTKSSDYAASNVLYYDAPAQ